jgi:tRNA/tmRNA/rRNA uracil-C5-methylase (TrmA/RlmC/RlmD family)
VNVLCPYFSSCGACQFLHIAYQEQLRIKKQLVIDYAEEQYWPVISDCLPTPPLSTVIPSAAMENRDCEFFYRNKVTLVAFREGDGAEESDRENHREGATSKKRNIGRTRVGYFHKDDSKRFTQIDSCIVASAEINHFLKEINDLIRESGIEAMTPVDRASKRKQKKLLAKQESVSPGDSNDLKVDELTQSRGSLRHIIVRSTSSKKLHIILVTNGEQAEQRGVSDYCDYCVIVREIGWPH